MSAFTERDAELIEETLCNIDETEGEADKFAEAFYGHMFETTNFKPLFQGDMKQQGKLLFNILKFVATYINDPETLIPRVERLGVR